MNINNHSNTHVSLYHINEKINGIVSDINTQSANLKEVVLSDTPPSTSQLWWNTSLDEFMRWDGNNWKRLKGDIYIGSTEPTDTSQIWIDNSDENISQTTTDLQTELRNNMNNFKTITDSLNYALTHELDPGYFKGIIPGTDPNAQPPSPDPDAPNISDGASGTVGHILLKRGLKSDIENLQEGELGFCLDTEELYVGNKGGLKLLAKVGGVDSSNGSGNVTAEYVELIASNGTKYRLTVNDDGEPIILNSEVDTSVLPAPSDSPKYKGLFINKVYGGGARNTNNTPVSHSFIELYNSTQAVINLNGLALQYGEYMGTWQMLPLRGEIKPFSSFLIRCAQHSDPYRRSTRIKVLDFDMSWDIAISDKGFKVYLNIPADFSKTTTYTNPANIDNEWTPEIGFIDLFGVGGQDTAMAIDGYVKGYLNIVNNTRLIKRKYSSDITYSFSFTGDNSLDLEYIDYTSANIDIYTPRSSRYGQWDYYYKQRQLDPILPDVITVGFGKNGNTTRTFTWQSKVTDEGYLQYKLKNSADWTTIPSSKKFVSLPDVDVTVHGVIVQNLILGATYVYRVGFEGYWSDEYQLEIIDATNTTRSFNMIQVTDQQGWDDIEYSAWGKANDFIETNETYDFILNTGDISQNGNRSFEWRDYFSEAKNNIRTHVHMTCVGNNDLVDKKDSIAYTYYSTTEGAAYPSVYSFNYGYVHYICLDSNILKGVSIAQQQSTANQLAFLQDDMDFTKHPENKQRWTIVYMHEAPYTIYRSSLLTDFITAFAQYGIDIVTCGHLHCYARSYPMGALGTGLIDVRDDANGVVYMCSQATGFKLSGKNTPATNPIYRAYYDLGKIPTYLMWNISYNQITMNAYRLNNIIPLETNVGKSAFKTEFDRFTLIKNEDGTKTYIDQRNLVGT